MTKILHWGPYPQEKDGGSVVNYYQTKKMLELRPMDDHYVIPKVPEELDPSWLPSLNYLPKCAPENIGNIMAKYDIPIVESFHMSKDDVDKALDGVHDVGGQYILWQTVHWNDDDIFKSKRLGDVDKIVAPTQYARHLFNMIAKIPVESVEYIPHAVDTTRYYKRKTILEEQFKIDKRSQKVILYSGRLSFWKGVQELIPIMKKLTRRYNCVFIIRGSAFPGNPESMKLAYIFERMSFNNSNIIFLPDWQPPSVMEELFAMTDILVFNSAHEGFGVPLIEAMASSAVPVATAIPNHIEIIEKNTVNGMLLEPRVTVGTVNDGRTLQVASSDQIDGVLQWLLENPDEMKVMGARGEAMVRERYDLTKISIHWLSLYDSLTTKSMEQRMLDRLKSV